MKLLISLLLYLLPVTQAGIPLLGCEVLGNCAIAHRPSGGIPPIACRTHADCRSYRNPGVTGSSRCEHGGVCVLPHTPACSKPNDCGFNQSCLNNRCVLGGLGAPCRTDSANCMPGFTCDASSEKCTKGVGGVVCQHHDDCGFGHSCFLPKKGAGVCRLGVEGTLACRRDMHCAGPLRCYLRVITRGSLRSASIVREYRCGRPVDLPGKEPRTFGSCSTEADCGANPNQDQLACVRGKCVPQNLGQPCNVDLIAGNRQCGAYTTCQNGRCAPATAGSPCRSISGSGLNAQCEPGTRCNAPTGVGLGRPGTCVVGEVGEPCRDGRECETGLVCGTSKKCTKSAEGQRCNSNYWCPAGFRCSKKSGTCRKGLIPPAERFPAVWRASSCQWVTDCKNGFYCRNGVCLPHTLGWACKGYRFQGGTACIGGVIVETGVQFL